MIPVRHSPIFFSYSTTPSPSPSPSSLSWEKIASKETVAAIEALIQKGDIGAAGSHLKALFLQIDSQKGFKDDILQRGALADHFDSIAIQAQKSDIRAIIRDLVPSRFGELDCDVPTPLPDHVREMIRSYEQQNSTFPTTVKE